jgi:hypothetical protein
MKKLYHREPGGANRAARRLYRQDHSPPRTRPR